MLQYKRTNQNSKNKINRKRNIFWFNPLFSKSVSTKIGHYFLNLLDKHFPKNHKFHNIFNRNNVKVSYSCTKNIKSIITNHNKTILDESETSNKKKCNCIYKNTCPLNGECQAENIIYQASLNSNKLNYDGKYYKGSCETTFKKRFANHKKSFNNDQHKNERELSKEVWNLKSTNKFRNSEIAWKIVRRCAL